MIFYVIEHKATKQLMPQMKRDRGYTHWNPTTKPEGPSMALSVPRLLTTLKQAQKVIVQWAALPNAQWAYTRSGYYGEDVDSSVDLKDDGRKKENLQVRKIKLSFIDCNKVSVAELADAKDLKSFSPKESVGSIPTADTTGD